MSSPHSHRSSREYHTPDIYSDAQALTARKDDYERAQEAAAPETYRDKYRAVYLLVHFYRLAFPYLSALTLGALAFFLTLGFDVFTEPPEERSALAIGIIGFVGFVLLIAINEAVKSRSLKALFKALSLKRRPEPGTKVLATVTTILSIIGSAAGVALLTWQISNKAPEIQAQAHQGRQAAKQAFAADSARIMQSYQPLIQSKRDAIQRYDPNRYRTLRDRLNNEAIELTRQMNGELSDARQRADGQQAEIRSSMSADLAANEAQGSERSWFAFAVLVALELMNLFCNRFEWVYLANVEREGIEFGALAPSQDQTMYEIQVARFSQWANQVAQQYGLNPPGQAGHQVPQAHDEKPPIGFQQGFKGGLNGGLNGGLHPQKPTGDYSHLTPEQAAEIEGYLRKYHHVVKAVTEGRTNREAAQMGSVSLSTVHNVKRCMRTIGMLQPTNT